ncbi:MAG: hypothetical protein ACRBN8_39380 [Nannocystales bacterium]
MSRFALLILLGSIACAGGDQNQPAGATLGSGSDSSQDTEVATTGISGGEGAGSDASATSTTSEPTNGVTTVTASTTEDGSDGSSGEEDGSSSSGGSVQSWHRYSLDLTQGTWSQVPLSEIWVGDNAPPPTGITATTSFTHFDRLFVIAEDRMVYEQADGVWQTPELLDTRFPAAAGMDIDAMVHTPGQEADDVEELFLLETPVAVVYEQFENGGLELSQVADLMDHDGGAPQGTVDVIWTIGRADPSGIGSDADWLVWHQAYSNGDLWRFNAAFQWVSAPLDDNVYFTGAAGEPDVFSVEAAYFDDGFQRAHFIAP